MKPETIKALIEAQDEAHMHPAEASTCEVVGWSRPVLNRHGFALLPTGSVRDGQGMWTRMYSLRHASGDGYGWSEQSTQADHWLALAQAFRSVLGLSATITEEEPETRPWMLREPAEADPVALARIAAQKRYSRWSMFPREAKPAADMDELAADFDAALDQRAHVDPDPTMPPTPEAALLGSHSPPLRTDPRAIPCPAHGFHYPGEICKSSATSAEKPTPPPGVSEPNEPAAPPESPCSGGGLQRAEGPALPHENSTSLQPGLAQATDVAGHGNGSRDGGVFAGDEMGKHPVLGPFARLHQSPASPSNGQAAQIPGAEGRAEALTPDPQDSAGPDTSSGPAPPLDVLADAPCWDCGEVPCACQEEVGAPHADDLRACERYVPPSIYKCRDCGESPCACRGESAEPDQSESLSGGDIAEALRASTVRLTDERRRSIVEAMRGCKVVTARRSKHARACGLCGAAIVTREQIRGEVHAGCWTTAAVALRDQAAGSGAA